MPRAIRVLAVAVPRRGAQFLVERGDDSHDGRTFLRAIGGGVEFGERAEAAVEREWKEEFGLTLTDVRPLGVLENLFTYRGAPGHEVVFVYSASLAERWAYERDAFTVTESAGAAASDAPGLPHEARWVSVAELRASGMALYPDGLLTLLQGVD